MDKVLLADGHARQSLALAKAFHELGCFVTAVCSSKFDVCSQSRYVDKVLIDKSIQERPDLRIKCLYNEVSKNGYTLAVAFSDTSAEQISLNKELIEKYCKTAVVNKDTFYLAYDKLHTMRICMENGIPCPKTYFDCKTKEDVLKLNLSFPLVIKPRSSYGAIGFHKVESFQELEKCLAGDVNIEHLVFQEYIPQTDLQYECSIFMDENSNVKSAMVFEKNRWFPVHGGSSTLNTSVKDETIVNDCSRLLKTMKWQGGADIDLIRDPRDRVAKIMEINPRISGSGKIVLLSGINLALEMLQAAKGEEITAYSDYSEGIRLRCLYTDFLWFLKSKDRFRAKPSWFSMKNTHEQVFSWDDPKPFLAFSIGSLLKLKKELQKRKG